MSRTLLLVDDSVTIQRVVELTFAHEDVRIVSMSDGQRALQWLEVDKPDIVVVDVGVPEVDGYTVASRVRAAKRHKDVPILLLAGAFEPVDEKRVREIGCDGVIVKPFEPQQLVERVKELIDVAPIKSAPRGAPVHGAPSVPASAAAVANPPALRAVRSMPPPAPSATPPEPVPAVPAAAASTSPSKVAPITGGGQTASPVMHSVSTPSQTTESTSAASLVAAPVPASTPPPVVAQPTSAPVASESTTPPVAVARSPQPLELPSRPMWQGSGGGAQPVPTPVAVAPQPTPLSGPQTSAKAALVNAFSALLAVDQAAPAPSPPPPAPTVAVVSETMIESAVRRVLQQMTEEHVRKIVTETAERLVREEIERIKENPE